jgi:ribosomal-protein-alanine N-acetyltransferase
MTSVVLVETARLILRTVTLDDIEGVSSSWKLDEGPIPPSEAAEKIEGMLSNHAKNLPGKIVHLCLAIIFKENDEFIGWCGLDHTNPKDTDPALFYLLKNNYWGMGLATEAARALRDYTFTQLELVSIHGGAAPDNLAPKVNARMFLEIKQPASKAFTQAMRITPTDLL